MSRLRVASIFGSPPGLAWRAVLVASLAVALLATLVAPPRPHLVWNVSASAPVGLYRVEPAAELRRGDRVVARLPARWRGLAARRHYLPANVPLVKRVAGVPGDRVCARGRRLSINGRRVAQRLRRDGSGRPLPAWQGCVTLGAGRYLLLLPAPGSFDGRYFGISDGSDIIGRAHLLWRR